MMNSRILGDLDNPYGALTIVRAPLMQVFDGSAYDASWKYADETTRADNAALIFYISISSSNKNKKRRVHFVFRPQISGEAEFFLTENGSLSSGLPMTSVNYNRYNIPVPVSIFIVRQATVSELGDVLLNYMIDPKGNTADLPIHYEFIPKNSSERTDTADRYGVLLYNRSGSAKQLGMQISFYDYEDE